MKAIHQAFIMLFLLLATMLVACSENSKTYRIGVSQCSEGQWRVMYINDVCAYTNRIYGIQKNCWSINNYGGSITVSDVKVSQY